MPMIITDSKPLGTWMPSSVRTVMFGNGEVSQLRVLKAGESITLSGFKADVGSGTGHTRPSEQQMLTAEGRVKEAIRSGLIIDGVVARAGDDIHLWLSHANGEGLNEMHDFAWDTFKAAGDVAEEESLYAWRQDLLVDKKVSGNIQGMGPGVAEMTFALRKTEPVIILGADKTSPFAWNHPIFTMFTDPNNTIGLIVDDKMSAGFKFVVKHLKTGADAVFEVPAETTTLQAYLGSEEYGVARVLSNGYNGEPVAVGSCSRLSYIAGKYVGKDDPILLVRSQSGLPAVGEVINPFIMGKLVPGGMRGSSLRPLTPCSMFDCDPTQNDGPPRVIGVGFQINGGAFGAMTDLLGDMSFNPTRDDAVRLAHKLQQYGAWNPSILPDSDLEYGGKPKIYAANAKRFGDAYLQHQGAERVMKHLERIIGLGKRDREVPVDEKDVHELSWQLFDAVKAMEASRDKQKKK